MDSDSNLSESMNIYDLVIEELGSYEEIQATARNNNQDDEADFSDNDIDEGDLVLSSNASITKYHTNDLKAIAIK